MQTILAGLEQLHYSPQEIDDDFSNKYNYKRFIDCGAYNGDTAEELNNLHGKIEKLALFEPDQNTFKSLVENISSTKEKFANEMVIYPCGVWSRTEKLKANMGLQLNSHIIILVTRRPALVLI